MLHKMTVQFLRWCQEYLNDLHRCERFIYYTPNLSSW